MTLVSGGALGRTLSEKTENRGKTGFSSAWAVAGENRMDPASFFSSGQKEDDVLFCCPIQDSSLSECVRGKEGNVPLQEEDRLFDEELSAKDVLSGKETMDDKGNREEITPDRIFSRFRNEPGAVHMRIPKFLLRIGGKMLAGEGEADEEDTMTAELISHIDNLRILVLEDCSRKVRHDFVRMASRMDPKAFERILQVKDDEDKVDIWVKGDKGLISEAVFAVGGEDCVLLHFKGEFREKDLGRLMEMKN